jgi:hypothetical protein
MAEYERKTLEFTCQGMNLSRPVDKLGPGVYRFLKNTRPGGDNQIWGRSGIVEECSNPATDAVHTIKRLNDPVPSPAQYPNSFRPEMRLVGAGTKVHYALFALNALHELDIGYSGDPLSICVVKPDRSPRPVAIIADSVKMRKTSTSAAVYQVGVPPPNFAPTASCHNIYPDGPDIGTSGLPYLYRFVARLADWDTGALSAPGPAMREEDGLKPGGGGLGDPPASSILVLVPETYTNSEVKTLDVYRFGGSLAEWIWVGSCDNYLGAPFTDLNSDADIAANPRLEVAPDSIHYQPFLTVDVPRSGTCTCSGHTVTLVGASGEDVFKAYSATGDDPYYVAGNQIVIGDRLCTFYKSPASTTSVEVVEDVSDLTGTLGWQMQQPEMARTSLPFLWGPFGGGETGTFLFAVGDTLLPGGLYWTEGNDPESHPPSNVLEITEPTERLQNGCMYDGRAYVFSTERMFAIYPSFGQASQFVAVEVPGSRGLYRRWALCSNGAAIFSRARDGIYASTGGESACISNDIAGLFGKEQSAAAWNAFDGVTGLTVPVPDPDEEEAERLTFADGYLYWEFIGTDGERYTMVYDADPRSHGRGDTPAGWISLDSYTPGVTLHYQEEGANAHTVLLGTSDGRLFRYEGYSDGGVAIEGAVRGWAFDAGDPRARKQWGDTWLDFDSDCDQITWKVGFDNFTFFSDPFETTVDLTGRQQAIGDINSGTGQYAANIGVDLSWSATVGQPKVIAWQPAWLPKPEVTAKRVTDWTDDGYAGDKFFQGVILTGDTLGEDRTLQIQKDGAIALASSLTVNHDGEQQKAYSFVTPFVSHMVRLLPTDANFWRLTGARWVWEPMPELTEYWQTQNTNLDMDGFFHHHHAYIALASSAAVTWEIRVDGVSYTYTIPSTGGVPAKPHIMLQPMKGKIVEYYRLSCPSGFRLFERDCEVWVKQWGAGGQYVKKLTFGDTHRVRGAVI